MKFRNVFSYVLSFFLVGVSIVFVWHPDYLELFCRITISDIGISICIALCIFSVSGLQYYMLLLGCNKRHVKLYDLLLIQIAMRFWGYIIPLKGGLIYSTALLRCKYGIKISEGVSMGIYNYTMSLFLTGVIGIIFAMKNGKIISCLSICSIVFIFSPIFIVLLSRCFCTVSMSRNSSLLKIKECFVSVNQNINILSKKVWTTIGILGLNLIHTVLTIFLYYWANIIFNLELSAISIVCLALVMKLYIVFRITPGNIGIEQLVAGAVVGIADGSVSDGIFISFFITLIITVIAFSVGALYSILNMKYFNVKNIKSLFRSVQKT